MFERQGCDLTLPQSFSFVCRFCNQLVDRERNVVFPVGVFETHGAHVLSDGVAHKNFGVHVGGVGFAEYLVESELLRLSFLLNPQQTSVSVPLRPWAHSSECLQSSSLLLFLHLLPLPAGVTLPCPLANGRTQRLAPVCEATPQRVDCFCIPPLFFGKSSDGPSLHCSLVVPTMASSRLDFTPSQIPSQSLASPLLIRSLSVFRGM